MLSTGTHLLQSTMKRPALSGTYLLNYYMVLVSLLQLSSMVFAAFLYLWSEVPICIADTVIQFLYIFLLQHTCNKGLNSLSA